jgi:hypothetical protein
VNPLPVIMAAVVRHRITFLIFVILVAIATATGVGITAQEAALRNGSARAADKFDLVIAAPGSQTDVVLAAIYLRPGTVPLIDPKIVAQAFADPHAVIVAPLGFGDSLHGSPIVGTVAPSSIICPAAGRKAGCLRQRRKLSRARPRRSRSARRFVRNTGCMRTMTMKERNITNITRMSPSSAG